MVELEHVYEKVNNRLHPPFQYFIMVVLSMTLITNGAVPLLLTFLTSTKDWQCLSDKCDPQRDLCEQNLDDDDWYSPVSNATDKFLKSYKVYCGYEGYFSIISGGYFAGFMIGILIGGNLMDSIGRHKTMFGGLLAYCFTVVLHASSANDFNVFAVAHLLSGLGTGVVGALYVYQTELTIARLRNFGSQIHNTAYSFGMLYGALLCYYVVDFGAICLWITVPALVFNFIMWKYVPESLFWLHQHNKKEEVNGVLQYIAKFNDVKYLPKDEKIENDIADESSQSVLTLFRYSNSTRDTTCIFLLSWFTASYSYWGLSFNVGELIGNLYINQGIIFVIDLINRPINYYGIKGLDRVTFIKFCNFGMAVSAMVCMIPYEDEIFPGFNLAKISALVGRMISDLYFSGIYLHTSEVLPTVVRGAGLSVCSSVARIGSILAPFVLLANRISPNINFSVIFISSVICYMLYNSVPETRGQLLPANFSEMESLIKGVKRTQDVSEEVNMDVEAGQRL